MVALIMLLVMTILGITSVSTSVLQEKMAGNMRDQAVAFEAAEAAVRAGENWISNQEFRPEPKASYPGLNGVWKAGILGNLSNQNYSWWTDNSSSRHSVSYEEFDSALSITQANTQPRIIIEHGAFIPDDLGLGGQYGEQSGRHYYKITGYGVGATRTAQAVVQSTFVKRFK